MTKLVWSFKEGNKDMKQILGGKGANLCEMTNLGLPVPGGFVVSTIACEEFHAAGKTLTQEMTKQILEKLEEMEAKSKSANTPLLLSVRSGAAVSMPGMMDTILNLGLNDATVLSLADKTSNERFAWDSYRRLIQMFGNVALGLDASLFEDALGDLKMVRGVEYDHQLSAEDLKALVESYKRIFEKHAGTQFPQDPRAQLFAGIEAVFGSWNNKRAISYRRINHITGLRGTAVNIQEMVFGNMGQTSGSGVCFTRNPSDGDNHFYGEYLFNAQGEDVVSGVRTPVPLNKLEQEMPLIYKELHGYRLQLEQHYKDMQDMEFTIQEGKLYVLQTRNGKRTAPAALRMAVEMVAEGLIDEKTAILRVDPLALTQLLHKRLEPGALKSATPLATGLPASPGAGVGRVVFDADTAKDWAEKGVPVILVRTETSPEDIEGMHASVGIATSRGGMTSHAAVVARERGKPCVAGCSAMNVKESKKLVIIGTHEIREGDWLTLDGAGGAIYEGQLPVIDPELTGHFGKLMEMADKYSTLTVRTNADTPTDANMGKSFGARGIGLVRTEHMFFEAKRIFAMRKMILADSADERQRALDEMLPFQKEDFKAIFSSMDGFPVVVRLLDPPLHEFLPKEGYMQRELANALGGDLAAIQAAVANMSEVNPMLGFRGCRLGVVYPEINEMQCRAIFEAALELKEAGGNPLPWIEIPLVCKAEELSLIKDIVLRAAEASGAQGKVDYKIGTMIETPRAAFMAETLAKDVEFISFGTNDLTQLACGFSRDDAASFLGNYVEKGIFDMDPFQSIDQEGVGALMEHCVKAAKAVNPSLEVGICGEHGGDPKSVEFCHRIGLTEVSCSPFRVPVARLAAAQAALR